MSVMSPLARLINLPGLALVSSETGNLTSFLYSIAVSTFLRIIPNRSDWKEEEERKKILTKKSKKIADRSSTEVNLVVWGS